MKGILGRKIGMTSVFAKDGKLVPVTVIEVEPNIVSQIKTKEKDGYEAIQLAAFEKREKLANKPEVGHMKKANTTPKRFLREIRGVDVANYQLGSEVKADIFAEGEMVDVTGTSKGKGFQGVIKRWNQSRGPMGHGSQYHRGVGSLGTLLPMRVIPGKKMPGHMGHEKVTIHDLVAYMEKRGIIIKRLTFCKRPYFYEIIDDSIFNREWVNVNDQSDLQVCKEGDVRNKRTLTIYNMYTDKGYKMYRTPNGECGLVHRLIMKTFYPVDNDEELYVDHINGIRDDNRLENLRWATELENVIYKGQNWDLLKDNFNRLLQEIGYDGMNKLLEEKLQEKNIF